MKTIAHITDTHFDEEFPLINGVDAKENWNKILKDISNRDIDLIIFGGDIGSIDSHAGFFNSLKNTNIDFRVILGNHDDYEKVCAYYSEGDGEGLYYFEEDDHLKYLYMDSSNDIINAQQIKWLEKQVDTDKNILLFIHHPVLSVKTILDDKFPLKNRGVIRKILEGVKGQVYVFCGHYHLEDELKDKNIHQRITPASSYQTVKHPEDIVIDNKSFGYRLIKLDEDRVNSNVVMLK